MQCIDYGKLTTDLAPNFVIENLYEPKKNNLMKKVICLIAGGVFALNVFAQSASDNMGAGTSEMWKDKFCAKMKNGRTIVMHNDKELLSDFTASSGVKIKTDGTVIKKDGSTLMLKDGQ